jgi:branched-subunit amino acid ABC-type transport system permease component
VNLLNIVASGLAFLILLFLMASGLSITLGLMNFANMARSSFAMFGGYVTVTLVQRLDWPPFEGLAPIIVSELSTTLTQLIKSGRVLIDVRARNHAWKTIIIYVSTIGVSHCLEPHWLIRAVTMKWIPGP